MTLSASTIALIIQAFQAAIAEAPQVIELAKEFKAFIAGLFRRGLISKEQQDTIFAHVDAIAQALLDGVDPPHWTVEPDPASPGV